MGSRVLRGLGDTSDTLVLGGLGEGEEAPVITAVELSCAMVNGAEFEVEMDQRAATMEIGCAMVNGARLRARALREGTVLPETDTLGWTTPDAAASPLWDLTVTIGGVRIPNAAITSFPIELDAHGGFESCAISFASKRTARWPRRAQIVIAYDGMHPFEGRLATQRRSVGTELGWSLEFVGNLNDLRNHRAFRRVYVDSDLDNWRTDQGPNTAANVFEVEATSG